ncbi:unnamed protein product [Polarella glacialis]|uniref:Uncharacterized protein n=1 Tax=Polarella glacialis TaxID=89957 RepID=A0A813HJG1_POLGL|nr:unnamed protein product [Polarella glacialis]
MGTAWGRAAQSFQGSHLVTVVLLLLLLLLVLLLSGVVIVVTVVASQLYGCVVVWLLLLLVVWLVSLLLLLLLLLMQSLTVRLSLASAGCLVIVVVGCCCCSCCCCCVDRLLITDIFVLNHSAVALPCFVCCVCWRLFACMCCLVVVCCVVFSVLCCLWLLCSWSACWHACVLLVLLLPGWQWFGYDSLLFGSCFSLLRVLVRCLCACLRTMFVLLADLFVGFRARVVCGFELVLVVCVLP